MAKKTFYVSIYCDVFDDSFGREMVDRIVNGEEVFAFLVRDSSNAVNQHGVHIAGGYNIWYLGCCEKSGHLVFYDHTISWGIGESSFDKVEEFVRLIYLNGHCNDRQFKILMDIIKEGRKVDCIYDIPRYLVNRRRGHTWTKTPEAVTFRNQMKELSKHVIMAFENSSYQLHPAA